MATLNTLSSETHYRGVLFDLDGTLLDTANDLGEALNHVLTLHQYPPLAPEHYRNTASNGAKGLLNLGFGNDLEGLGYDTLRAEFLAYYQDNIAVHTCLYNGIAEMLEQLNQHNIPWGIVTNKPIGLTNILLPHFSEFESCKVVLGGDSLPQAKPHPAPLLKACQALSIKPEQCLYIGDAPRDIEAANAAKMKSVVAEWGYIENKADCQTWQASTIIANPMMIIDLLTTSSL